jgi:hypothetical protein
MRSERDIRREIERLRREHARAGVFEALIIGTALDKLTWVLGEAPK